MSVSSIIDQTTGKIYDDLIPQGGGINLAKGQIITATATQEIAFPNAPPADGSILSYDSNEPTGLKYIPVPGALPLDYQELISANAGNNPIVVPAPAHNGYVLTADTDPANASGLAWKAVGGSGTLNATLPLIDEEVNNVSTLSINFSASVGEIPYGNGTAKTGAFTNVPTAGQILGIDNGVPTWINAGGSGTIVGIAPIVEVAGAGNESKIGIGFGASVGEIPYGNGTANTGALTNTPTAGQILGISGGVPAWINPGASGTITGTFPIVEAGGPNNESVISIGFANKGELACGAGGATAGAGVILPPATADDYVLSSFASAPSGMRWKAITNTSTQTIVRSTTASTSVSDPQTLQDTLILVAENPQNSWDLQEDPTNPGLPITPYEIEAESEGIVSIDTVACSCICVPEIINGNRAVQLFILTNTEQISVGIFYQGSYLTPAFVSGILNPLSAPASTLLQNSFIVYGSFEGFHYTSEQPDAVCSGIAVIDCSQLSADVIVVRPLQGSLIGTPALNLIGVANNTGNNRNPAVYKMIQVADKLYHFGYFDGYNTGDPQTSLIDFTSIGIYDLTANAYFNLLQLRALGLGVGIGVGYDNPGSVIDAYIIGTDVYIVGYWEVVLQTDNSWTAVPPGMTGFAKNVLGSGVNPWSTTPVIAGGFATGYCIRPSFSQANNLIIVGESPNTPIFLNTTTNTLTASTGAIPASPQQGWLNSITGSATIDIGFGVNAYDLVMFQDKTSGNLYVVYFVSTTGLVAQALLPSPTGLKPFFVPAPFPPVYNGPYLGFPSYGIRIVPLPSPNVRVVATGGIYKYDPASHANLDFTGNFYYNGALKNTARFSTANLGNESQSFVASTSLKAWIQTGAKTDGLTYLP